MTGKELANNIPRRRALIHRHIRINRYLALCGHGSRRSVEALISTGSVTVNGTTVRDLFCRVGEKDRVKVKGKICTPPSNYTYLLFHKPRGCLCSVSDPRDRKLIYDLLPKKFHHLKYVGRLDYNTSGLLLLTNDGAGSRFLLHPSSGIPRTYRVKVKPKMSDQHKKMLAEGVEIEKGLVARPSAVAVKANHLEITLKEGKNREVRRIMEVLGYQVRTLQRISFGKIKLEGVNEGKFRLLSPREIDLLIPDKIR